MINRMDAVPWFYEDLARFFRSITPPEVAFDGIFYKVGQPMAYYAVFRRNSIRSDVTWSVDEDFFGGWEIHRPMTDCERDVFTRRALATFDELAEQQYQGAMP